FNLPSLNGITSAPILFEDGSIHLEPGYEFRTGLWCEGVVGDSPDAPDAPYALCYPVPTRENAESALRRIRQAFRTFPFADSPMVSIPNLKGSECTGVIG